MMVMVHLAIENGPTFSVALVDGPVAFKRGGAVPIPSCPLQHSQFDRCWQLSLYIHFT